MLAKFKHRTSPPPPPTPQTATDSHDCENKLVVLLNYEQFQFIKILLKNRWAVLYCTLLAKTEGEAARKAIEEEMKADPEKAAVLKVSGFEGERGGREG